MVKGTFWKVYGSGIPPPLRMRHTKVTVFLANFQKSLIIFLMVSPTIEILWQVGNWSWFLRNSVFKNQNKYTRGDSASSYLHFSRLQCANEVANFGSRPILTCSRQLLEINTYKIANTINSKTVSGICFTSLCCFVRACQRRSTKAQLRERKL